MSMNTEENNYVINVNDKPCGACRTFSYTPESYQEEQQRIHNEEDTPYSRVMRSYHDEDEVNMLRVRLDIIEKRINEKLIEQARREEELLNLLQRVQNLENYLMDEISDNGGERVEIPRPILQRQTNGVSNNRGINIVYTDINEIENMSVSSHDSMPSLVSMEDEEGEQFAQPLDEPEWDTSELPGVYKATDKNKRVRLTL